MYTFKLRRDLAAVWASVNPILSQGEPGYERDTGRLKLGDGVSTWTTLDYLPPMQEITDLIERLISESGVGGGTGGAVINDGATNSTTVWSGTKTNTTINSARTSLKTELLGGAASGYDTLQELKLLIDGKASSTHTHAGGGTNPNTPGEGTIPPPPDEPVTVDPPPENPTVDPNSGNVIPGVEAAPIRPTLPALRTVVCDTLAEVQAALLDITMGDDIQISAGVYSTTSNAPGVIPYTNHAGESVTPPARFFVPTPKNLAGMTTTQARSRMPMIRGMGAGPLNTVLQSGNTSGYTFFGDAAHRIWVENLTVRGGEKGIMFHRSENTILYNVRVENTGNEAVHWRNRSKNNLAYQVTVDNTGLTNAGTGEGFYIGMSVSTVTAPYSLIGAGNLDNSDGNRIVRCTARRTTAESVDVKEMTTHTYIGHCVFEGQNIVGASGNPAADSYVDVKGNNVVVEYCNATLPSAGVLHAFETHILLEGWGNNIVFRGNNVVAGGKPGSYGYWVQTIGSRGSATGNVVYSNNVASGIPDQLNLAFGVNVTQTTDGTVTNPPTGGNAADGPRSWFYPNFQTLHTPIPGANGLMSEVKYPALATYNGPGFVVGPDYVDYTVRADGARSSNSGYPRQESRGTTSTGLAEAFSSLVGYHTHSVFVGIHAISANKPRVIMEQTHWGTSDLTSTRLDQKIPGNLSSGLKLEILYEDGNNADPRNSTYVIDNNYVADKYYLVQKVIYEGKIHYYVDGAHVKTFYDVTTNGAAVLYNKHGAYFLTKTGNVEYGPGGPAVPSEPADSFVTVRVYGFSSSHSTAAPVFPPGPTDGGGGVAVSDSDPRLSDNRTPIDGSVTNAKVAVSAAISLDKTADSATRVAMSSTERTKLAGVSSGATVNSTDAALRDRTSHTGLQPSSTISDFTEAAQDAVAAFLAQGTSVTLTHNDAGNTLTIAATGAGGLDAEAVRDAIGVAMVGVGNISVVPNDAADTITISTTATVNRTDASTDLLIGSRLRWAGAWIAATTYLVEDVVSYLDGVYRAGVGTVAGTAPTTGDGSLSANWTRLSYPMPDLSPFVLKSDPVFTAQIFEDVFAHHAISASGVGKTVRVDVAGTTPVWVVIPHATNTVTHTQSGLVVPPWNPIVGTTILINQRNTAPVYIGSVTGVGLLSPPSNGVNPAHIKAVKGRYDTAVAEKDNTNNWIVRDVIGVVP